MTISGSLHPPEDCARLPQTLPATETPAYEKSEMKPMAVPAKPFVAMLVAVTPVSAWGPYRQNPPTHSAAAPSIPDGRNQNPARSAAVSAMRSTQSRGALPPKKRSVAQPANTYWPLAGSAGRAAAAKACTYWFSGAGSPPRASKVTV